MLFRSQQPDRAKLIPPEVMVAPLIWLCSNASDGVNGQRFIGMRWDKNLPVEEAAKNAGAPMAWQQLGRQAIMPNGNLIVANTGNNTLVEMTPKGKVLDTKVVDTSKTSGIFGVAAAGTSDSNTTLFYTDTNTNTLHELEP